MPGTVYASGLLLRCIVDTLNAYALNESIFVIADVNVVFPWSTCPIIPLGPQSPTGPKGDKGDTGVCEFR
jgi:hypothetical protein